MRIFITGASGMVGSALVPQLTATSNEPVLGTSDVRDPRGVWNEVHAALPHAVIHLAALTNLEYCEQNPMEADAVNHMGTMNLAEVCVDLGIPLVYLSTAGVFDGEKKEPYVEDDRPAPLNMYGWSKLMGERIASVVPKHLIVRAGWMVGGGGKDHKFVGMIVNQLREGATTIQAVNDRWGSPTYTGDLARNLTLLLEAAVRHEGYWGTYHMAGGGEASRYLVAKEIVEIMGAKAEVVGVGSEHFAQGFPVKRARSEVMANRELERWGMNLMRPWREALRDYLSREVLV